MQAFEEKHALPAAVHETVQVKEQALAPPVAMYLPAAQIEHVLDAVAPVAVLYLPASQLMQWLVFDAWAEYQTAWSVK